MKKTIILALTSAFTMAGGMGLTSCGGDDSPAPVVTPPAASTEENKPAPTGPKGSTLLTPAEQKAFLDETAVEFMRNFPSSEFQEYKNLADYIGDTYKDYDTKAVEDWADEVYNACVTSFSNPGIPTLTNSNNSICKYHSVDTYTTNYTDMTNYLIMLSQFKGNFTAENGKWTKKESDHLQFNVKDAKGQPVSISLTNSGKITTVHVAHTEKTWYNYQTYESCPYCNFYKYIYNDVHLESKDYRVEIPENITITLTQGNKTLIATTLNPIVNLNMPAGEEFSLGGSNFAMTMSTVFSNGFSINVNKCQIKTSSDVAVNTSFKKGEKTLIDVTVTSSIEGLPHYPLSQIVGDFDEDDFKNTNAKNPIVEINILDKVQIRGNVKDVRQATNYMNDARKNENNERTYKSNINSFNSCVDLGLYFNFHDVKQASVVMDPFMDYREVATPNVNPTTGQLTYNYDKQYFWSCEPVINFFDGSKYSTFTAFFNDRDFKNTIKVFEDLMDEYDRFLGEEK